MSDTPIFDQLLRDLQLRSGRRVGEVLAHARRQVLAAELWADEQVAQAWREARTRVAEVRQQVAEHGGDRTARVRAALQLDSTPPAAEAPAVEAPAVEAPAAEEGPGPASRSEPPVDEPRVVDLRDHDDEIDLDRPAPVMPGFAELLASARGTPGQLDALFGRC